MPCRAPAFVICLLVGASVAGCDPARTTPCPPDRACPGASPEVCAAGPEAALYGRSAFVDGTCAAREDAACAGARLTCAVWGQCSAPRSTSGSAGGACPESGADPDRDRDFLASRNAACGGGRTCVAARDEDCRGALACTHEGRCVARDGVCVAASDADCRASVYCGDVGWCSLVGGRCTARSAEDCRTSRACDDWGECGLASGGAGCATCDRSVDCAQEGLCARVLAGDRCLATEARHCQRSAACRTEGRCRASQGRCVK